MVAFENERKKDRELKQMLVQERQAKAQKELATNFQQAEVIRQQEKGLKQAQFFYKELKKMQLKEEREKRAMDA